MAKQKAIAHGGNHQCYYLRINNYGVFAYDAKTNKELFVVGYVRGRVDKAIDTIKNQLCEARLVGARFVM